jgi:hypothetical protein
MPVRVMTGQIWLFWCGLSFVCLCFWFVFGLKGTTHTQLSIHLFVDVSRNGATVIRT